MTVTSFWVQTEIIQHRDCPVPWCLVNIDIEISFFKYWECVIVEWLISTCQFWVNHQQLILYTPLMLLIILSVFFIPKVIVDHIFETTLNFITDFLSLFVSWIRCNLWNYLWRVQYYCIFSSHRTCSRECLWGQLWEDNW